MADPAGPAIGTVTSFEDDRGLGTVTEEDGTTFDFHCTAIADGTTGHRGRSGGVSSMVRPGHRGRLEARRVVKR